MSTLTPIPNPTPDVAPPSPSPSPPAASSSSSSSSPNSFPDLASFISHLRSLHHRSKLYSVHAPLGKGKFATVYKAQLISNGELFALKRVDIFSNGMSESSREKCLKEVQLLRRLEHPHIIKYVDSWIEEEGEGTGGEMLPGKTSKGAGGTGAAEGEGKQAVTVKPEPAAASPAPALESGMLVIVLAWARGGDLKKVIRKKKAEKEARLAHIIASLPPNVTPPTELSLPLLLPSASSSSSSLSSSALSVSPAPLSSLPFDESICFSESTIWRYCFELSSGLHYMNCKRIMHRDLKPANILLSSAPQYHALLGDLGLSRYFNDGTLEAFSKVGTVTNHDY